MLQRWWLPSAFALVLAVIVLGPVLGPGALLNLDLVGVEHWPTPRSMWGIGPELPRSVPAELLFSGIAYFTSGATAMKVWFVLCISGSFLAMFRLLRGMDLPMLAWYAGGVAYAMNPYLLTRLAVGHTTLAGVYVLAPIVLPIILRGSSRRPQVILASAALAFLGFFGGIVWGAATLFGLAVERRPDWSLHLTSLAMHLPWLVPSLFLLSDGPNLIVDDVFRPGGGIDDALSLAAGYGFWQPVLEVGVGVGWLSAGVGAITLALAVLGSTALRKRLGFPAALFAAISAAAIVVLNRTGSAVDWIFDIPGASVLREPHRFLVLVLWWIIPAAILGTHRLLKRIGEWSTTPASTAGLLIPMALSILLVSPAIWGLHDNVEPVQVPNDWNDARELTQAEPGTILVLPWDRYLNVSFANERRVLNPALRFFGPDIIHGGELGLGGSDSFEAVDARLGSLRTVVDAVPTGEADGADFARHGIRWILVLHEVDYRGFLALTDVDHIDHIVANQRLDLFRIDHSAAGQGPVEQLRGRFTGYIGASPIDRVLASPSNEAWLGSNGTTSTGLAQLPAGKRIWHYRSAVVLFGWLVAAIALVAAVQRNLRAEFDNHRKSQQGM